MNHASSAFPAHAPRSGSRDRCILTITSITTAKHYATTRHKSRQNSFSAAAAWKLLHLPIITRLQRRTLSGVIFDLIREPNVSLMPFARFVVIGILRILPVPQRLVGSNLLHVQPRMGRRVGCVKDVVHLFQTTETGFRVEEVDDGQDDSVSVA